MRTRERVYRMAVDRQQLHDLIDAVDARELNVLYYVLMKFIPEDIALPDEIEAIRMGREDFAQGECVSIDEINWE